MFHGIVQRGKQWFRLLTGAPLLDGDEVVEELQSGSYQPAFLNHFFPGLYRVEVRKIKSRKLRGIPSASPVVQNELFSSEVIRWSTANDQYMIRVKGNKGWLESFKEIGLIVRNSKKMSKRLVELARLTSMWLHVPDASLKVEVIPHSCPDCYVDGISFISRGLAMACVRSNTTASREWRAQQLWKIHSGKTVVVSFRMLTPNGLIKGNALVLPKRMMKGYDVRTFSPNIKSEIRTTDWQWVTIEPSYGVIPIKSDDLTHSIYRKVNGLYNDKDLLDSLEGMLKQAFADLKDGKRSEWLTRLVDSEQVLHQDTEDRFAQNHGLVNLIQQKIAELHRVGIKINASQTLMYLCASGLSKQLLGIELYKLPKTPSGHVWENKTRHWFPVPWAYSAHVITKEVLEFAGFRMPKGDFGFFHEQTHCFVVPGAFFQRHFEDHGGWDEDDGIKIHVKQGARGSEPVIHEYGSNLYAWNGRNPNDVGEFSIIPIKEVGPVYHTYTDQPPVLDFDELFNTVPQFSSKKKELIIGELPGSKSLTIGDEFSLADESRVRTAAELFPAGTGGTVIPKMIHAALVGGYIPEYYASNEDIIDALQQGMATVEDIELIQDYVDYMFRRISSQTGGVVDAFWYKTRMFPKLARSYGIECGKVEDSSWVQLHRQREDVCRKYLIQMLHWLNANIIKPEVFDEITWTEEEILNAPKELNNIKDKMFNWERIVAKMNSENRNDQNYTGNWVVDFVSMLEQSDATQGQAYTNRKILRLANAAYSAKERQPMTNHDKWLYSMSLKTRKQPIDWLVRALSEINR